MAGVRHQEAAAPASTWRCTASCPSSLPSGCPRYYRRQRICCGSPGELDAVLAVAANILRQDHEHGSATGVMQRIYLPGVKWTWESPRTRAPTHACYSVLWALTAMGGSVGVVSRQIVPFFTLNGRQKQPKGWTPCVLGWQRDGRHRKPQEVALFSSLADSGGPFSTFALPICQG